MILRRRDARRKSRINLCAFASEYFEKPVTRNDIVWTYSGVRPLYDDGARSATAATRDYALSLDAQGPVLLNVFGGKITTYRKLAEAALRKARFAALPAGRPGLDGGGCAAGRRLSQSIWSRCAHAGAVRALSLSRSRMGPAAGPRLR